MSPVITFSNKTTLEPLVFVDNPSLHRNIFQFTISIRPPNKRASFIIEGLEY